MTSQPSKRIQAEIKKVRELYDLGLKIVMGAFSIGIIYKAVSTALTDSKAVSGWTSVGLSVVTVVILFFWIWSPRRNIELIEEWFAHRSNVRSPQFEWAIGLALVVLFASLLWTTSQPLIYAAIFILYCIVYLFNVRHFNEYVQDALQQRQEKLETEAKEALITNEELIQIHNKALRVLEYYYLKRPHLRRIGIMAALGTVALIMSLLGHLLGFTVWGDASAALIIVLTFIVAEVYIIVWRFERDKEITPLEKRRNDILDELKE